MAKTKTKSGKTLWIALSVVLVIALAVVAMVTLLAKDNTTPDYVMECEINPKVQFVMNSDDKVISVNYLNEDAEVLLKEVNFKGMSAQDASQLFVELSTEAGYLAFNTTGTQIKIDIMSDKTAEEKQALKNAIVEKVHSYLDENGIIACAVVDIEKTIEQALQNLGYEATDLLNKTYDQLVELANDTAKYMKDVALSLKDQAFTAINNVKAQFSQLTIVEDTIDNLNAQITSAQATVDGYLDQINELKEQLKTASDFEKIALQAEISAAEALLIPAQDGLNELKNSLNEAKEEYLKLKKQFEAQIDEALATLEEQSKQVFEQAKQLLEQKQQQVASAFEQYKQQLKDNQAAIQAQIDAYRQSVLGE